MRPPSRTIRAGILAGVALAVTATALAGTRSLASSSDAFVSQASDSPRTWVVGSRGIAVTIDVHPQAGLRIESIVNPATSTDWVATPTPDTRVVVSASPSVLGAKGSPFVFSSASATSTSASVTLALSFTASSLGLRATRNYVCFPAAPVVETWTTVESSGGTQTKRVDDLAAWQMTVAGRQVTWVTGLHPELMASGADAFTVQQQAIADGQTFSIGAQGRSSESALPYFVLENGQEQLFGGLEWSGAWRLTMTGVDGGAAVSLGLPPMSTKVEAGASVEGPHGFFGVTAGSISEANHAVRTFVDEGLRAGRPFNAWVTSNTWFAHGVAIDAASMTSEIDAAADLGAELFVLDAGYYPGPAGANAFDFTSGLGSWTWDSARFPGGLAALARHAHDRGLKFGLWVEPERVALSTVGSPGLAQTAFLAMEDGRYDPALAIEDSTSAQICLASSAARAWVFDKLTQLIDAVHPDYLKWDNNFWINCNRAGHGHDATDGNFQHVQGLYSLLGALRSRYPDLVIENCSGGGHRMDFGMLRYTDVGWMDDRTSPAPLVRHNLEGLLTVMPPSYLLSFVLDSDANPSDGVLDVPLMFRSRMPGVLGLGFSAAEASDEVKSEARPQIAAYKALRDIQSQAHGAPLSPPADGPSAPEWDAVEEVNAPSGDALIFAFQADSAARRTQVQPVGLLPDATYRVESLDGGLVATASGADLMADGIEVDASSLTSAHLLVLRVVAAAAAAVK